MSTNVISTPITFNFGTTADSSYSASQCSSVLVTFYSADNPSPQPQPPYYLQIFPASGVPDVINVGNFSNGAGYNWTVNYGSGTQFLIGMADSLGNSGGVSPNSYTVSSGSTSCSATAPTSSVTVSLNYTSNVPQCSPVEVSWNGGTPPYTMSVLKLGTSPINVTGITGSSYNWVNTIQTGGQAMIAVSDSSNNYFTSTRLFISGTGPSSCLSGSSTASSSSSSGTLSSTSSSASSSSTSTPPPPSSSSSSAGIIAGAVSGGVVAAIVGLVIWFCLKRNKRRKRISEGLYGSGGGGGEKSLKRGSMFAALGGNRKSIFKSTSSDTQHILSPSSHSSNYSPSQGHSPNNSFNELSAPYVPISNPGFNYPPTASSSGFLVPPNASTGGTTPTSSTSFVPPVNAEPQSRFFITNPDSSSLSRQASVSSNYPIASSSSPPSSSFAAASSSSSSANPTTNFFPLQPDYLGGVGNLRRGDKSDARREEEERERRERGLRVVHAVDGGRVIEDDGGVEELPPTYMSLQGSG